MSLALIREYINLVDENGDNKGFVLPCDLYKHMLSKGMEPAKAALASGLITLAGGSVTNPSFPLYAKTDGPDREEVPIPRGLDPDLVLKQGGKTLLHQVLSIGETLLIPNLAGNLERRFVVKKEKPKKEKVKKAPVAGIELKALKALKHKKGVFKVIDGLLQNKALLKTIGSLGKGSDLLNNLGPLVQQFIGK